nr:reverse transcriptase domain-containing protein [Tanacetum cinerariifolium]
MTDQRPMAQLLQAPTNGYEDAIVVPAITADNFELKHGLLTLVQNKQFYGHDKEDPHAHILYFNKITSTLKFPNVLNTSIKLMLFLFSLEGAARIWLEKEPPRSIFTCDDLVSKFINQFFPPSKTTSLRNEITNFQQRFDESFSKAWDRFKDLLRAYQDSLNSADRVVAKVSTNASTSGVSPGIAELKDMVKALLLDKKGQNQSPAPVNAVEESYVTCGGAHSYRNYPATDGNVYHDNIQEFVSQASAVNYNQGNTSYCPSMMSNQIRPPGFPPVLNNQNVQRNNQNRFIPNQNQGNNFNKGPVYQPSVFHQLAYQAPTYQALAPQTQGVSKEDFSAYAKANDAVMKNMQTQGKNMQNQLTNLTDLIMKFVNSNATSTSSLGTLPSNTIANLKSDLKAITTRSGPEIALVSASKPNPKASIPYPSRINDERNHEKANNQIEKFYQIFKDMSFEISFADALILIPKFASTLKAVIGNQEKLIEMARTPLNEHCSAVLLKKLPEKLGDPCKFLISCDFPGMAECLALADLGASINLMPFSMWKRLSLLDLTPTCMTLELADRSISRPVEVAEDVYVKVGSFHFPVDFVVVDFDADPRVLLILGRSFLKIGRALIDVFEVDEPPTVELKVLPPHLEYAFLEGDDNLPVIIAKDLSVEEKTALLTVLKSHKRAIAWKLSDIKGINPEFCTHKILMEEDFEPTVQHQRRVNSKIHDVIKQEVIKLLDVGLIYPIFDSPWVSPDKTTFTCPYGTFAYRRMPFGLCNAPGTFQRCMMVIFHDMIEKTLEVFMDDFFVFGNSFQSCLSHLEKMLKR